MTDKETFFIRLYDEDSPSFHGIGEAAIFRGLSSDDRPDYESKLKQLCDEINYGHQPIVTRHIDGYKLSDGFLHPYSSIMFGLECAVAELNISHGYINPAVSPWERGERSVTINGLIWMGDAPTMLKRIDEKLSKGFKCLKLKIGGINFKEELQLLGYIRQHYDRNCLTIRLDANGAFSPSDALDRLGELTRYDIHSIEQPIRAGQWKAMSDICHNSPIPITLDEELIGSLPTGTMQELLDTIMPQYIILKPSLCGGLSKARKWCNLAESRNIGWWYTSALESNIGLNAIAREVSSLAEEGHDCARWPQGLGTGALYTNNIPMPLQLIGDQLSRVPGKAGNLDLPHDYA